MRWWVGAAAAAAAVAVGAGAADSGACESVGGGVNLVHNLPRVNRAFAGVSSNLADYELPVQLCEKEEGQLCAAPWVEDVRGDLVEHLLNASYQKENPDAWANYAHGVGAYVVAGMVFAVLSIIASLALCCCRKCCCGGPPVLEQYEDGELLKPKGYPMSQTILAYACLVIFALLMFLFALLSHVKGNKGFTEAQLAVIDAPGELADVLQGATDPLVNLITSIVGSTGVTMMRQLNNTLVVQASLVDVHESIGCASEVYTYITNVSLVEGFIEILDDLKDSLDDIPTKASVESAIDDVETQINDLTGIVDTASASVGEIRDAIANSDIPALEQKFKALEESLVPLEAKVGTVTEQLRRIVAVSRNATATIDAIDPLIDLSDVYTIAEVTTFKNAYATFRVTLDGMPTGSNVSVELAELDEMLDNLDQDLALLEASITSTKANLDNAPTLAELSSTLGDLFSSLDTFSLTSVESELSLVTDFLVDMPSLQPLTDQIQDILDLQTKLECIFAVADVPRQINENLVELPESFQNISAQFDSLNATLNDSIDSLTDVKGDIATFQEAFNGTIQNATATLRQQIDSAKDTLSSAAGTVASFKTQLDGLDQGAFEVEGPLNAINDTRTKLNDRSSSATFEELDNERSNLITALQELESRGFLDKVTSVEGANPPPDSWVCTDSSTSCYSTAAPDYSACSPDPSLCEYPYFELEQLKVALTNVVNEIDGVSPSLEGTLIPSFEELEAGFAALDVSCCTDLSGLEEAGSLAGEAATSIGSTSSDLSVISELVSSLDGNFLEVLDGAEEFNNKFDEIVGFIESFNETVLSSGLESFEIVIEREAQIYNLLFNDLEYILQDLSKTNLESIVANDGLSALAAHIAEQLDRVAAAVSAGEATLSSQLGGFTDILDLFEAVRDRNGTLRDEGAIYYLARLYSRTVNGEEEEAAEEEERHDFSQYEQPLVNGHVADGTFVAYNESEGLCYSDKCLRNTVLYFNDETIEEAFGFPFPFSRTTAMAVPFMIPALLMIMALSTFAAPRCGYALAVCSGILMPILFIIFGSVMFPAIMVAADVCASTEDVGIAVLASDPEAICVSYLSGEYQAATGYCKLELSSGSTSGEIEIEGAALFESLVKGCTSTSGANLANGEKKEPLEAIFDSFGDQAVAISADLLDQLVTVELANAGVVLRENLTQVVFNSSANLGRDLVALASDMNDKLGCDDISGAYIHLKETVCCDFGNSMYWALAPWYLIAFTMLFIGLPVGCFAATRLRNIKESREHMRLFYSQAATRINNTRNGFGQRQQQQQHHYSASDAVPPLETKTGRSLNPFKRAKRTEPGAVRPTSTASSPVVSREDVAFLSSSPAPPLASPVNQ